MYIISLAEFCFRSVDMAHLPRVWKPRAGIGHFSGVIDFKFEALPRQPNAFAFRDLDSPFDTLVVHIVIA